MPVRSDLKEKTGQGENRGSLEVPIVAPEKSAVGSKGAVAIPDIDVSKAPVEPSGSNSSPTLSPESSDATHIVEHAVQTPVSVSVPGMINYWAKAREGNFEEDVSEPATARQAETVRVEDTPAQTSSPKVTDRPQNKPDAAVYQNKDQSAVESNEIGKSNEDRFLRIPTFEEIKSKVKTAMSLPRRKEQKAPTEQTAAADAEVGQKVETIDSAVAPVQKRKERYDRKAAFDNIGRVVEDIEDPSDNVESFTSVLSRAHRRFKSELKDFQVRLKLELSSNGVFDKRASTFNDTITVNGFLPLNAVSLGTENIYQALRDPDGMFLDTVNEATNGNLTAEECLEDINVLVEWINTHDMEVIFEKQPVSEEKSAQRRRLHVHVGRGIALHPVVTKAYNADFDGDPGSINFDQTQLDNYKRSMSYLVDLDGNPTIDPDFFPLDALSTLEPGADLKTEIYETMTGEGGAFEWNKKAAKHIIDAYIKACNEGDWVGLLNAVRKEGVRLARRTADARKERGDEYDLDKLIDSYTARILKSVYQYAIDRRGVSLAIASSTILSDYNYEYIDPDDIGSAHSRIIRGLVDVVEEIAMGTPAMSFQEFTRFYVKQWGDAHGVMVHGKNIPFRLLADFAKCIKRTDLITIGDRIEGIDPETGKKLPFEEFEKDRQKYWRDEFEKGSISEEQYNSEMDKIREEYSNNVYVTIHDLWSLTCAAGVTKLISSRLEIESHTFAVSSFVKKKVLQLVPLPEYKTVADLPGNQSPEEKQRIIDEMNNEMFREFMHRFKKVYNRYMRLLNVSQVMFRSGMMIHRENTLRYDGFQEMEDCAKAFAEVYRDYRIGRLFPTLVYFDKKSKIKGKDSDITNRDEIRRYYENMSVGEFVSCNRFDFWNETGVYMWNTYDPKQTSVRKYDASNFRFRNDTFTPLDVLIKLADRKSKQFGEYHEAWTEATERAYDATRNIRADFENEQWNEYAADVLDILVGTTPKMFEYFGMTSYIEMIHSKWGKRLMSAKNVQKFQGMLLGMAVIWRLRSITEIRRQLDDFGTENFYNDPEHRAKETEALYSRYLNEIHLLESSSVAWEVIVRDMLGESNAFEYLLRYNLKYSKNDKEKKGKRDVVLVNSPYSSSKIERHMSGYKFWNGRHKQNDEDVPAGSLVDFLTDPAYNFDTKIGVLRDVICIDTGTAFVFNEKHILGMLMHNPSPVVAGTAFEMDAGIRGDIDNVKSSVDKLTSFRSKTPERLWHQAQKIIEEGYKDPKAFENKMNRLATEPGFAFYVDMIFAADVVSSVFDKVYGDSEKGKQNPIVSSWFNLVSIARSGTLVSHLQQTDNRVVNMVGFDQIGSFDIIRVLGDPSIKFTAYDEFGIPCEISRKALCGDLSTESLLEFLSKNPRIAAHCKRYIGGAQFDVKGKAFVSGLRLKVSEEESNPIENIVFSLLLDRPRFLALSGLVTKSNEQYGRNIAIRVKPRINELCKYIAALAVEKQSIDDNAVQDKKEILIKPALEKMGITYASLMDARLEGRFRMDDEDIASDADIEVVQSAYDDVLEELQTCVDIVAAAFDNMDGLNTEYIKADAVNFDFFGIDQTSFEVYLDAVQQFSGARTQTMVGVEGSETGKTIFLKEYARNMEDRWITLTAGSDPSLLDHYRRKGVDVDAELAKPSNHGMLVIDTTLYDEDFSIADISFERNPRAQTTSLTKFLEFKRDKGAEEHNLKVKKFGNDGTQSIVKYLKYCSKSMIKALGLSGAAKDDAVNGDQWTIEDAEALLASIDKLEESEEKGSLQDQAIPILAKALWEADERLGYIDMGEGKTFQMSDYYNLAEFMTTEVDGKLYVRSLEQLAAAFRNRLSDDAMYSGEIADVMSELMYLRTFVGTPKDPMMRAGEDVAIELLNSMYVHGGQGTYSRLSRAMRPYSSSVERNYQCLQEMEKTILGGEFVSRIKNRNSKGFQESVQGRSRAMFFSLFSNSDTKDIAQKMLGFAYPQKFETNQKRLEELGYIPDPMTGWIEPTYVPDSTGSYTDVYDYIGRPTDEKFAINSDVLVPGPQNLVYIHDKADASVENIFEDCWDYGITVAFTDPSLIPSKYINDIQIYDGFLFIPMFDIRLNGGIAEPIMPAPAQYFANEDNFTVTVAETTYEIMPGDASGHIAAEGLDKVHIMQNGDFSLDLYKLFPTVLSSHKRNQYRNSRFTIEMANLEEIAQHIIPAEDEDFGDGVIDLGYFINEDRAKERLKLRIAEYAKRFYDGEVDENGVITSRDCRYDTIIAFIKITIDGKEVAFAPVVAFHQDNTTGRVPSKFSVDECRIDDDMNAVSVRWTFTDDLRRKYLKFFEGIGASNKMIIDTENPIRSRSLRNGMAVDIMYSLASVKSRLFPQNLRIMTLINLFFLTRIDKNQTYNYSADCNGAFPDADAEISNAESAQVIEDFLNYMKTSTSEDGGMSIVQAWNNFDKNVKASLFEVAPNFLMKEGTLRGFLSISDWAKIVQDFEERDQPIRYNVDNEINSLVKWFVDKCVSRKKGFMTTSPSLFLQTHSVNYDNQIEEHPITITEFEAFMDPGIEFQNVLMKFFHSMCPTLCPDSIDGKATDTLCVPVAHDHASDEYGVLKMAVPHWSRGWFGREKRYEVLENVFISLGFFGDDFAGFKRINSKASLRSLSTMNVAHQISGRKDRINLYRYGRMDMAMVPSMNHVSVSAEDVMESVDTSPEVFTHGSTSKILDDEVYGKKACFFSPLPYTGKNTGSSLGKDWGTTSSSRSNWASLMREVDKFIRDNDIQTVISDLQPGVGLIAAGAVFKINSERRANNLPLIKLVVAVPVSGFTSDIVTKESKKYVPKYMMEADKVVYVTDDDIAYQSSEDRERRNSEDNNWINWKKDRESMRDEWMVNNSDIVFAFNPYSDDHGPLYATRIGKDVHRVKSTDIV